MVCMFLNRKDEGGLRLFRCLLQKGIKNLFLVSAEELVFSPTFTCGLEDGKAFFNITLQNGLTLQHDAVTAVINRIQYLPLQHLQQFIKADRAYVESELMATFTFLFSILPNQVLNKPSGLGLHGRYRSQLEWECLARKAGLATGCETANHQTNALAGKRKLKLLFFHDRCFANAQQVPFDVMEQCTELGLLSGERLLEIELYQKDSGLCFLKASTWPPLETVPDDFLQALIKLL